MAPHLHAGGVDVGGGLGIDYRDGGAQPPALADYAALARLLPVASIPWFDREVADAALAVLDALPPEQQNDAEVQALRGHLHFEAEAAGLPDALDLLEEVRQQVHDLGLELAVEEPGLF